MNTMYLEEDDFNASIESHSCAMQAQINAGLWVLEGSQGRAMMAMIESGHCMLGKDAFTDFYGSPIPSRDQVVNGTKGSPAYVESIHGEDWVKMLEGVE